MLQQEKEVWHEKIACGVPNKHWPMATHNFKHLQQKILTALPSVGARPLRTSSV